MITDDEWSADIARIVKDKDLKTRVYERLRTLLERQELPIGKFLGAGELSAQLAVSRTPVREALLQLQEEGFVEIVPSRGIRVLAVTANYVRSVYEMRIAIEGYAAWRAATEMNDAEGDALAGLVTLQEAKLEADDPRWLDATEALHRFLVDRLKNDLLSRQVARLMGHHMRIRRLAAGLRARRRHALDEHREIAGALLQRNAAAAYDAMARHLMSVASDVMNALGEPASARQRRETDGEPIR